MLSKEIGALLIVDPSGHLLGILSERDLLMKVADPKFADVEQSLERFMTSSPETVTSTDTLAFALHKMDVGGYRHLPVLTGGMPTGVISVRDMLTHITRMC